MLRMLEPEVMDTLEEAEAYDSMDHSEPNEAFVGRLTELCAGGRMLDIGTGPGDIPILICNRLPNAVVCGLDRAWHMIRLAQGHLTGSPFAHRITYGLADAKRLPFASVSFDTVFSNTMLHHIPDPRPVLAEAQRVLRPDGVLLIRDLYRPCDQTQLKHLVASYASDSTPVQRELFCDSLHAAFTPQELKTMVEQMGISRVEVVVDTDRHVSIQTVS